MEEIMELQKKREQMEHRAKELTEYLTGPGMPGLKGGLDDSEGYPRADVDIVGIVTARHELACLNTDYNEVMDQIEKRMVALHSESSVAVQRSPGAQEKLSLRPFAYVAAISEGSPGWEDGIKLGDKIIKFGSITNSASKSSLDEIFAAIPNLVRQSIGKQLPVEVLRTSAKGGEQGDSETVRIALKPRNWAGNGVLGFRIEPLLLLEETRDFTTSR